jgi:intracellular sulfur oxidation DsrE/DsrF family protein
MLKFSLVEETMNFYNKIITAILLLIGLAINLNAQNWEYPVIKGYGPAVSLPNAAVQPDKSLQYKILFDISKPAASNDQVNPGLDHVARLINVFATAGMMPDQMELVVIIHSTAAPIVLKNEQYKTKYGVDNPNIQLLGELKKSGVVLYVCGQTLADYSFKQEWVNPDVTLALSALTVVPTYQLMGYALMPW